MKNLPKCQAPIDLKREQNQRTYFFYMVCIFLLVKIPDVAILAENKSRSG